jgi:ferredoxin
VSAANHLLIEQPTIKMGTTENSRGKNPLNTANSLPSHFVNICSHSHQWQPQNNPERGERDFTPKMTKKIEQGRMLIDGDLCSLCMCVIFCRNKCAQLEWPFPIGPDIQFRQLWGIEHGGIRLPGAKTLILILFQI